MQRAVENIYRISAPAHFQHRRVVEMLGKPLGIDGGRSDDDFQIGAARQQLFQVAEQKINIKAALVRFVDDDGVVGGEVAVGLRFGQQNAIGHQLHVGVARGVVVETHFIADGIADVAAQFFGNPLRHRTRR